MISQNMAESVKLVLDEYAAVSPFAVDNDGHTALMYACRLLDGAGERMVALLLEHKGFKETVNMVNNHG